MAVNEEEIESDTPDESGGGAWADELAKLQTERDELYDRLARSQAEFQNSRRRLEADAELRLQYANSALIKALIPVIDNFERALAVDPAKADAASILKGLQVVHDQWLAVLKKEAVETIAPEPGEPFDPTLHEALIHQPTEKYKEPTVTQLLTKGYALHGRTLRPASVAVSQ
jgi:molecular chaperone GrpE